MKIAKPPQQKPGNITIDNIEHINTVYSMQFESSNISDKAAIMIREMIVTGALADGERINEVHLAENFGFSRTPLREGLGRLVVENVVMVRPRKGFFVSPLTLQEFEQIYDIRPMLDPEALRLSGIPSPASLNRLEKLNEKLRAAKTPSRAIEIDDAWHMELLAACPNRVLVEMIQQIIIRTHRYEYALFRETKNVWTAGNDHDLIITALRHGDLDSACAALKQNMQSGKEPIVEWLTQRIAKHNDTE